MATTLYFSATRTPGISPSVKGTWTATTETAVRLMDNAKDGSTLANTTIFANADIAAAATHLARQFVSRPLAAGIAFVTTDTFKCYVRCMESGSNDNINRNPIGIFVVSLDGATVRATLKAVGHYGPNTTEWNTSLRNKTFGDGDVFAANYTTVSGDRLLIEIGGMISSAGGRSERASSV